MKIYKVQRTVRKGKGAFSCPSYVENYWCVIPPIDAQIVSVEDSYDEQYDTLYAIEYNVNNDDMNDDLSIEKLIKIMFSELSISDCMKVCKKNRDIKKAYFNYLQEYSGDKKIKKQIKMVAKFSDSISGLTCENIFLKNDLGKNKMRSEDEEIYIPKAENVLKEAESKTIINWLGRINEAKKKGQTDCFLCAGDGLITKNAVERFLKAGYDISYESFGFDGSLFVKAYWRDGCNGRLYSEKDNKYVDIDTMFGC